MVYCRCIQIRKVKPQGFQRGIVNKTCAAIVLFILLVAAWAIIGGSMCFVKIGKRPHKKTAREDIHVIKYGWLYKHKDQYWDKREWHVSLLQDYAYKVGEVQPKVKLKVKKYGSNLYSIDLGYHSYRTFEKSAHLWHWDLVAHFIIPKGTEYYEDKETGHIVSETIVYAGPYGSY